MLGRQYGSRLLVAVFVLAARALLGEVLALDDKLGRARDRCYGNLASPGPDLVITGIGDSGTRGVQDLLHKLGMRFCSATNDANDNLLTEGMWRFVQLGERHSSSFLKQSRSKFTSLAAEAERQGAHETLQCICNEEDRYWGGVDGQPFSWGFKNPRHFYLGEVIAAAFGGRTKALLVARDPRDICSGDNQKQLHLFGSSLWEDGDARDCWTFWARAWRLALSKFKSFAVVRIEDLTTPEPVEGSTSWQKAQCLLGYTSMQHSHVPAKQMLQALGDMHDYASSYLGNGRSEEIREYLESQVRWHPNASLIHPVMRELGYDLDGYGLTKPELVSLCHSPAGQKVAKGIA